jgi:hypothetical protein
MITHRCSILAPSVLLSGYECQLVLARSSNDPLPIRENDRW